MMETKDTALKNIWEIPNKEKTIFIIKKPNDELIEEYMDKIITFLSGFGIKVVLEAEVHKVVKARFPGIYSIDALSRNTVSALVVIGGDGTILWANRYYKNTAIPMIIAFAMGTLSYLCNFDITEFASVLSEGLQLESSSVEKKYYIEFKPRIKCKVLVENVEQSVLECKTKVFDVKGQKVELSGLQALNDITIDRGPGAHLTYLDCFVNEEYLTTINGDGVIVSTPTGSTAYNMGAGGPLIHYNVRGIVLTPICPRSLSFRPVVFPDSVTLGFRIFPHAKTCPMVSIDGHTRFELQKGEILSISCSSHPVPYLLRSGDNVSDEWCFKIQHILNWNAKNQPIKNSKT